MRPLLAIHHASKPGTASSPPAQSLSARSMPLGATRALAIACLRAAPRAADRALRREYDNYPEGEIAEMVSLYRAKGFSAEDANRVIGIYTSQPAYKEAFIDHMMVEELGYVVPRGDSAGRLWLSGLATGLSFAGFGSLPLWMVAALESFGNIEFAVQAGCGAAVTMVALFGLGVCKVSALQGQTGRLRVLRWLFAAVRVPALPPRAPPELGLAGQNYAGAQFHVVERPADDGQRGARGRRGVSRRRGGERRYRRQGLLHHRPRALRRPVECRWLPKRV